MQKGTSFFTGKASEDIATTSVRTSSTDFEYGLRVRTSSTDFEYGLRVRTSKDKDTYGYIYVHMDTHGYIEWIHMGAQEPGCGTKLAAGPWGGGGGPGSHGPWPCPGSLGPWPCPWALALALSMGPGPRRQFCATAWLLGPHMYPFYVSMCVHMYIDVSICILFIFLTRSMSKSKIVSSYLVSRSRNR